MRIAPLVLALVGACSAPPLTIELAIQSGSAGTCPQAGDGVSRCTVIQLACPSMLLIRVLDPNAPEQPLITSCQRVTADKQNDLCSIASVGIGGDNLPATLPERTLEVQVAVLPLALDVNNQPDCEPFASDLSFAADGVPVSVAGQPPIAGRAYYHPGDSVTVVELGCTDLEQLNTPMCRGANHVAVSASVVELDTQIAVSSATAGNLLVSVGEPQPQGSGYVLNTGDPTQAEPLTNTGGTPPAWSGDVSLSFSDAACIVVVEDTTPALACTTQVKDKSALDLIGIHITADRLAQIADAVRSQDAGFRPTDGLVIGIVLDQGGSPVPGAKVTPSGPATVSYLSADGTTVQAGVTSSSGIFVSTDAPFQTTWSTNVPMTLTTATGFGGLVEGKVTVVVLQASQTHT